MKVISLTEPWASLILYGHKKIETRSWKTNYRGDIYIHASLTKIKQDDHIMELEKILNKKKLHCGEIICKCNLTDCVCIDKSFIEKIKKNKKEYICGEYKVGRYAWILEDIEPILPIKVKGHLGIWNYNEIKGNENESN